jgi:arylsulfatase A-like enzyme
MRFEKNKKFYLLLTSLFLIIFISGCIKDYERGGEADYKCPDCNVILITIDALRPDHLGCYGYERNTSPNIDRLAKEGILFKNAVAQASWTLPSFVSILTSLYPIKHQVDESNKRLSTKLVTLPEILRKNGYVTMAFVSQTPHLHRLYGLNRGFDLYKFDPTGKASAQNDVVISWLGWLEKNYRGKFFLMIHYFDPHISYSPPRPFNEIFLNDSLYEKNHLVAPKINDGPWNGTGGIPKVAAKDNITNLNYYISQYDGEIRYTDTYIGKLLEEINRLNLTNRTIVIVTADHGESLGEHNSYFKHGDFVYDTLIKVPLIIRIGKKSIVKLVKSQAESIDITPTILDILNIQFNETIDGESMIPLIFEPKRDSEAFSETDKFKSIRTNEWKYIHNFDNNSGELYNLKKDPKELKNVINEEPEIAEKLRKKLFKWMAEAVNKSVEPEKAEIDEETKERLRSLGYLV